MTTELTGRIRDSVAGWAGVTVGPHRFGGVEFKLGRAEVGHLHRGAGLLDIPFPVPVRDALLAEGWAVEHHVRPASGWVTFVVRGAADVCHALKLLRLSYLRYHLRTTAYSGGAADSGGPPDPADELDVDVELAALRLPEPVRRAVSSLRRPAGGGPAVTDAEPPHDGVTVVETTLTSGHRQNDVADPVVDDR